MKINPNLLFDVLYDNTSGSTGNITLSKSVEKYSYVEIYYKNNDNLSNSTKVENPQGKTVLLMSGYPADDTYYIKSKIVTLNKTSLNVSREREVALSRGGGISINSTNNIKVIKVLGYK